MHIINSTPTSRKFGRTVLLALAMLPIALLSSNTSDAASIDPQKFHQALYELHRQTIKDKQLRLVETEGQYNGSAAEKYRYRDTEYYDASNGRLLSHVRRDANRPDALHHVEVNIYDSTGRVVRDFGSLSLPWAPSNPVRTFINLHRYNDELHSFRQFSADGDITYESCNGLFDKRKVRISLDGTDIKPPATATAEYKACFDGMESGWAAYAIPH